MIREEVSLFAEIVTSRDIEITDLKKLSYVF